MSLAREWEAGVSQTFQKQWFQRNRRYKTMSKIVPSRPPVTGSAPLVFKNSLKKSIKVSLSISRSVSTAFPNLSPLSVSLLSSCQSPCPSPCPDPTSLPQSPKRLPAWMPRLGQFWFHGYDYFLEKSKVASIFVSLVREWEACVSQTFQKQWFQRNRRCRTMSKIVPSPSSWHWKCSARFQKLPQKID